MRATTLHAAQDIRFTEVEDPRIEKPTDAIVKVSAACICGSDLWPYRGENPITPGQTIGHECLGVIEEIGSEVSGFRPGDLVVVDFGAVSGGYCSDITRTVFVGDPTPRMREVYDATGDNREAVARGLERSGRIVTSAALIVVVVAGSFAFADIVSTPPLASMRSDIPEASSADTARTVGSRRTATASTVCDINPAGAASV